MPVATSTELLSLTLVALFTGLMWVPIIVNRLLEMGLWPALRNPQPDTRAHADWAWRLSNAHRNAFENLAVFAPLALSVHVLGLGDDLTAQWSVIFVAARVAHALIYTLGIPLLRTLAFLAGFFAQMVLGARLLGWG
ncbi:MAG: MAPEG family protein [Lysobacterales bacterium]